MTEHAVYAPSSASRWFKCPGSIRLSKDIPRSASVWADAGTAAHDLAAICLNENHDPLAHLGDKILVNGATYEVTEEMVDAITEFTTLVRALVETGYKLHVEVRLDLGHLFPGQFGTADVALYKKKTRQLVVLDLKYGRGVEVQVQDNPQLLAYASGAVRQFGNIQQLTLMVCQPRLRSVHINKMWDVPLARLQQYEQEFRLAVEAASQPDAPLVPGSHCMFCPATPICPALKERALAAAKLEFVNIAEGDVAMSVSRPVYMTPQELGQALDAADMLEHWVASVRQYALQQALEKRELPTGYKLVRKNTHRKWIDSEEKVEYALTQLHDKKVEDIYVKKLISPAQAEKLVGKVHARTLSPLIVKPLGDPTLAHLSDKREALAADALKEFSETTLRTQLIESVKEEMKHVDAIAQ